MKNKTVILIIVLAMAFALVFAACQTNDADKTPSGDNNTSGDINSGDSNLPSGDITSGDVDLPSGDTDTEEPETTPEEPETIEVDYQEYMQEVLTKLENEEGLVYNNLSTWSTARQDALKEYLDTNYGEQFMTGDTTLDKFVNKSVVGYDFDFENNIVTALVQATSPFDNNQIRYSMRMLALNDSLENVIKEYFTNQDIKETYGDLTNSYEDKEGNITVFVSNGQKVDFSTTAILDGTYKNSNSFATININQSINYSPSEYEAVKDVYNFIFQDEQYEQIERLVFANQAIGYGLTTVLGKEGYTFSVGFLYYNSNNQLVSGACSVETPSNGASTFLKISLDSKIGKDYAIAGQEQKVFGNGNTIVRVECLESEN